MSTEDDASGDLEHANLFAKSTHQHLVYFGHRKNCGGFIVAATVLAIQFSLYGVIVAEGLELLKKDEVDLKIGWFDCDDGISSFSQFACEAEVGDSGYTFLGFVLLAFYLMGDVVVGVKAFFLVPGIVSKITSLAIIAASVFAGYAGGLFAWQGVYSGSPYDAIVNCVGVLFINDIDDKLQEAIEEVNLKESWYECCCCCPCCETFIRLIMLLVCIAVFVIVGIIAMSSAGYSF